MRLIDADELRCRIVAFSAGCNATYLTVANIVMMINQADTVDAMPVVRCKDCKFAYRIDGPKEEYDCRKLSYSSGWLQPQHFCSYGERKAKND